MTSEVAVLTKQCVVLAADSAVTTGDKIFNTVNKVFALSKFQPVGIMAYSSAEVMGVPVETAIKGFRGIRGRHRHDHLEQYADAFEEFLRNDDRVFSPEARRRALASAQWELTRALRDRAYQKLDKSAGWGHPTVREARGALLDSLGDFERAAKSLTPLAMPNPRQTKKAIADAIAPDAKEAIEWLRGQLPVSPSAEGRIKRLVLTHCLCDTDSGGETGFVIAGFGYKDVFPRLRAFEFCHSALGVHKVRSRVAIDIGDNVTAHIVPFGQADVMETFVEGFAPEYRRGIGVFLDRFFEEKRAQFEKQSPKVAAFMESMGKELKAELKGALDSIRREDFIRPLMGVVRSMPKEELAVLAESLINVTALKRRASRDAETVGGPTDVAIISKGDGFIWAKRKHYFDSTFNPAFTARYWEEGDEE